MFSKRNIQRSADAFHRYSGKNILIADCNGKAEIEVGRSPLESTAAAFKSFVQSGKRTESGTDHYFSRMPNLAEEELTIAVYGSDAGSAGKFFEEQLKIAHSVTREDIDKADFYRKLLHGDLSVAEANAYAYELGIKTNRPRVVYVLLSDSDNAAMAVDRIADALLLGSTDYVLIYHQKVLVVIHEVSVDKNAEEQRTQSLEQRILRCCSDLKLNDCHLGKSALLFQIDGLRKAFEQAKKAISIGVDFGRKENVYCSDGRLLENIIIGMDPLALERMLNRSGRRAFYEELDPEMERTALEYIKNSMKRSAAADDLYIHRNTLAYRLKRIRKKSGLDLNKFDDACVFMTELKAYRYLKRKNKSDLTRGGYL